MSTEPRFVYRADHPHGPNVIDRSTGKWMGIDLARQYAAVVNAVDATPSPSAPGMASVDAATVEQSIGLLVSALAASKGWMRDYADAIIRDAIDRVEPVKETDVSAIRDAIDLDLAAAMLEAYADCVKRYASPHDLGDWHYLPEVDDMVAAIRAIRGGTP